MRRSIYKLTILRKEHLNHEKIIRNKRTTVVSYIKKSARRFLATWIQVIFATKKHFEVHSAVFLWENNKFK